MPVDAGLVHYADFKQAGGRDAAHAVLGSGSVDAIFVANSLMAVGVLEEAKDRGLAIGTDIDIVAFDDAPWTRLLSPSISVVRQPAYAVGHAAGTLLLDKLADPDQAPQTILLNATMPS